MPKKEGDRVVRFTNPCDEVPVCDAGTIVRCSKPFCKFIREWFSVRYSVLY
jgi:hypothetical protein